jgi:hypothetical protein
MRAIEAAAEAEAAGQACALLCWVSDTLGHPAGDDAAARTVSVSRPTHWVPAPSPASHPQV